MSERREISCVTVFGGTGFLGSKIVTWLSKAGVTTRVAVRHPDTIRSVGMSDDGTRIVPACADVRDETTVATAMKGCDAVVNAVGLYVEQGAQTFEAVHELGALNVARQAAALGIARLVHISGIGADLISESHYVRTRAKAELLVRDVFPQATILRPSVLFAPDDNFLNSLWQTMRVLPVVPLFGQGRTRLQPVYAGDVAEAVVRALREPNAIGKTYELGGPRVYSYRDLIDLVLRAGRRQRSLVPLPFPVWHGLAAMASLLPSPPLTRAQVTLMKSDNVVAGGANSFAELGIIPTALEDVLRHYAFYSTRTEAGNN